MERILNIQDDYPQNDKASARTLLRSIEALHACGILHCDIKPLNVLWDGTSVVVVDFGHAQMIEGARSYAGTPGFTAPEVFYDKVPHSELSAAYSVGKTLELVAAEAQMLHDKTLSRIIAGLTTRNVEERWILSNASEELSPSRVSSVKRQRLEEKGGMDVITSMELKLPNVAITG